MKHEVERFGYRTDDIDKYVRANGCNETDYPVEFKRRQTVCLYALDTPRLFNPLFWEHELRRLKPGGDLFKKRYHRCTYDRIRTVLRVIYYRFIDLFH